MWSAPWWLGAEIAVTFPTTKKNLIDGQFSKLFTTFILHVSGGSASNGLLPIILLLSHKPLDYKWSGSNDPKWMIPGLFQHRNAGFLLSCHQIRTQLFQWLRQSGLMLKKEERQLIWNSADETSLSKPHFCLQCYNEKAIYIIPGCLNFVFLHPNKWQKCQQVSLLKPFSHLLLN